jgi:hypothetical protein
MNPIPGPTGSPEGNFPMSIIDSLMRLERIGDENSKTNRKLIEAAADLAQLIVSKFAAAETECIQLKTTYKGLHQSTGFRSYAIDNRKLIFADIDWEPAEDDPYARDERYVALNREHAMIFSRDVANGLLDLLADLAAKRLEDTEQGLAAIEAARAALPPLK